MQVILSYDSNYPRAKCITQIIMILNKFHEEIEISYDKEVKQAILITYMKVAKTILT
jgi:hypothetical protein